MLCILNIAFGQCGNMSENNYKKTIAIDLDGVLDNYQKYDEEKIPKIRHGAKEFIQELYELNYDLVLFTTRPSKKAKKWLIENEVDCYFSKVTNEKPLAYIYLDDRAIQFNGDYKKALNEITQFRPYWKN